MNTDQLPFDRRQFLFRSSHVLAGLLLARCGDETFDQKPATGSDPSTRSEGGSAQDPTDPLNLLLNLAYLGAQFYGFAARGSGLASDLTAGVGTEGAVIGGRSASFADDRIAACAAELADDKQRHVAALRAMIGPSAAAVPAFDLSTAPSSAFSIAAQAAGLVAPGASFDPYSGDEPFLLAAFLVEHIVAATYRTMLLDATDPTVANVLSANLADSIYHDGLIRALLDDHAVTNPAIGPAIVNAGTLLAILDGSSVGDQTTVWASGISSDIRDGQGRPIPFTRVPRQVLQTLYLSGTQSHGFLPAGVNGMAA